MSGPLRTTLSVDVAAEGPEDVVAVGVPVVLDGAEVRQLAGLERLAPTVAARAAALLGRPDATWLRRQGFTAAPGQSLVLRSADGGPSVVLVGLGQPGAVDPEGWRKAAAALVRSAGQGGTAVVVVPEHPPLGTAAEVGAAVAEGAVLAAYRFEGYRSAREPCAMERLSVLAASEEWAGGVQRGQVSADAVVFARDLANTPPSDLTPERLARRAAEGLGELPGTTVEVWDAERIAAERLGGLLGVSRGSTEPPRLVRATYEPIGSPGPAAHLALVGKGVTFDSGGLSLKTAEGMTTMKTDMSGAAIVLGALAACARLGVGTRVTALAPLTENMPGGAAMKPGDVLTIRNGTTIEVLNTDAEGRLVLADALALAAELRPDAIVDVATLTGAVRMALGTGVGGLFGSDDRLVRRVASAGARAGERWWAMPLPEDYGAHIDSDVADMKNVGRPGEAGAIVAAMLLARFVDGVPWAHLDIAGTGRSTESNGYLSKGGTGFGVRTLVALADDLASRAGRHDAHPADS